MAVQSRATVPSVRALVASGAVGTGRRLMRRPAPSSPRRGQADRVRALPCPLGLWSVLACAALTAGGAVVLPRAAADEHLLDRDERAPAIARHDPAAVGVASLPAPAASADPAQGPRRPHLNASFAQVPLRDAVRGLALARGYGLSFAAGTHPQ